jgi:hypothetical protein
VKIEANRRQLDPIEQQEQLGLEREVRCARANLNFHTGKSDIASPP